MQARDLRLLLEDAARASGEIARKHFRRSPETWEKSEDAGPVTVADIEIDTMLRHELLAAQPDFGWLSEETEDDASRLNREYVFIVDPIDGTRAFIAGEKSFSHSLAVVKAGQVIAAVVYLPILDRMYSASIDEAATMNGTEISASARTQINGSTVLAARSNFKPEFWNGNAPPVTRKFRPSLAYRLCLAAEARFDAMLTIRDCWEWDIAAGDLIVRQAGGTATDRLGRSLKFNNPQPKTKGCLAGGPDIHAALLSQLNIAQ